MVVGHRAVGGAVELCKLVHILPHSLVVGVEDMRTVAVHVDALHILGVDVARDMVALIDDEAALFACLFGLMGKHGAVQAGAHDEIIILFHGLLSFFFGSAFASEEVFFWDSRYWSMAVWMRARAASGVICLSCAAAMVWWPPPPRDSMMTCTLTAPRLRAEMFTPVPTCTATKLASTFWMVSRSLAACAMATLASGATSPLTGDGTVFVHLGRLHKVGLGVVLHHGHIKQLAHPLGLRAVAAQSSRGLKGPHAGVEGKVSRIQHDTGQQALRFHPVGLVIALAHVLQKLRDQLAGRGGIGLVADKGRVFNVAHALAVVVDDGHPAAFFQDLLALHKTCLICIHHDAQRRLEMMGSAPLGSMKSSSCPAATEH